MRAITEAADPEAAARELRAARGGTRWGSAAVSGAAAATPGADAASARRAGREATARGYARSRERDDAVRAKLEPLARASGRSP